MQADDRLIHFSTELIHAPKKHERSALQKLYYELSQTRANYDSSDFSRPTHARFFSKRGKRTQSIVILLADRAVLVEEWADIALVDFLEKIRIVASRVIADLGVEHFAAQSVTLRSTFALSHYSDARKFLLEAVCGQAERIEPHFRRPLQTGGLRFVLPQTPEHPGTLQVLIESSRHNSAEVLVEVKGLFQRLTIDTEDVESAVDNVRICRSFILESAFPYLNQYDTPQENPV